MSYVLNPRRHGCGCSGDYDDSNCWNCGCNIGKKRRPRRDVFYTGPCPPDPDCECKKGCGCGGGCGHHHHGGSCGRGGCGCDFAQCRDADCFDRCTHDCRHDCRRQCWRECGNDPECRARCEADCFAECDVACDDKLNRRCRPNRPDFCCELCGGHDRCDRCGLCTCQCQCDHSHDGCDGNCGGNWDSDWDCRCDRCNGNRGCGCNH